MIAYPAIDLRGGRVVQLVGGRPEDERVSLPDPARVARQWIEDGFLALHIVDLDAALGTGHNRVHIADIVTSVDVPVQVGGGMRDEASIAEMIGLGVQRVIVGTRAIEDTDWLAQMSETFPGRLVLAADVRGDEVVTRGWTEGSGRRLTDVLHATSSLPLAAVLITDVGREGRMVGADVEMFERAVRDSAHSVLASGGIRSIEDLRQLAVAGVAGAVLGMSLYTGALDPRATAREFSS